MLTVLHIKSLMSLDYPCTYIMQTNNTFCYANW